MDEQNLDRLLAERREQPLPILSSSFQQDVWRGICHGKAAFAEKPQNWLSWLLEPLFHPAMFLTALSVAVFLGVTVGSVETNQRASETRLALDLQVFGNSSPALPATLLSFAK